MHLCNQLDAKASRKESPMKLIKMLSLTVVAGIAAMAFVGTSAALAETTGVLLCEKAELKCTTPWKSPVTLKATATNPKLLTSIGTLECEKSAVEVTLLQPTLAALQLAHILALNFTGNCHLGSTKCTLTVQQLGGISITHGPNPLEWRGVGVKLLTNTAINMKCGFLVNCTYEFGETGEVEMTATNDAEGKGTTVINEEPLKRSSGFCPETTKWDATYTDGMAGLWLKS
jgi:hypothetical protein